MGPDPSDGIITNIDRTLGIAYVQDTYENTLFHYDLSIYTGKDILLTGTQVAYYKLYNDTPIAVALFTIKETDNSELLKRHDEKHHHGSHFKQRFEIPKYKFLFFGICLSLGIIAGLLELF